MIKSAKPPLIAEVTLFLVSFVLLSFLLTKVLGQAMEISLKDFRGNTLHVSVSPLVLGCILIFLAAHFAAKILVKPIKRLDEWTMTDNPVVPSLISERTDELGHLARSIIDMRKRLERQSTMLQLDRDVYMSLHLMSLITLAEEPGPGVLKKLLSIIITQTNSEAALLLRRDPYGGGFSILCFQVAGRDTGDDSSSGLILDADIPREILVRFLDAFELPFKESDIHVLRWASKYFGSQEDSGRKLINIPVETEGRYLGSLLLLRSKPGLPLEKIRPFAAFAVSSVKYLETSIERNENWSAIMVSLSRAVDAKSEWTSGHSERLALHAVAVGRRLQMGEKELNELRVGALLHDIGKIAIPEIIIDKPERLSDREMDIMKQHPQRGAMIVDNLRGYEEIRQTISCHHERWDGTGYPCGLAGESIPLHARIIAIADVYDALVSDRPYRKGLSVADALDYLETQSWIAFDGNLVKIFRSVIEKSES